MNYLLGKLWGHQGEPIKPLSNSLSPKEEQLAEYKLTCLDQRREILTDRNDDPLLKWEPAVYDPRFPNTDVTNWCVTSYEDYYRCRYLRGKDYEPCNFFKNVFKQICPQYMIDRFDRARENNIYLTLPPNAD